jgi:DNA-binding transcriptional ArsR family regulator
LTIVNSDELKTSILSALADKEMLKILDLSMYTSKSVNDILRDSDISYTTVYRKIKWLLDKELLVVDKINISSEGKKYTTFRSVLKSLVIRYKQNEIIVEAEKNVDLVGKMGGHFFSIQHTM